MYIALIAFCICIAYLLGSINTSIIISKILGNDIRNSGSGNAGATNTLRTFGKGAAIIVVIFDGLKGIAAVLFAKYAPEIFKVSDPEMTAMYLAGLFAVIGHVFPVYFGFKGGKGIMTAISVVFVLDWEIGLILLITCLALMLLTRYVSFGSCVGAALFPILVLMFHEGNLVFIIVSVAIGALALVKHRTNIQRLMNGTESKLNFKK